MLTIEVVNTRAQLRQYIHLPENLPAVRANWIPPIYLDEWNFHNPKTNSALSYSETIRMLAFNNGKPVGRVMGIINKKYNGKYDLRNASFFNLDCIDDQSVAHSLLQRIERWAKEKGMNKIIGPYGFSDKDPQGLQVEGFEHLPVIATPVNPAYLQSLVEAEGYQKEIDCVSYQYSVPGEVPSLYHKVFERICRNKNIRLLEFKKKSQLKPHIMPVLRLVNETYSHLFGFVTMTETEMKNLASQYLFVLDPEFVKVIQNEKGETIAFGVGLPDISPGIQKAKGRLFPFGFIHIMRAMKSATQLNLMLGAVKPSTRNLGLNALLATSMISTAIRRGIKKMDSHLILENNQQMRKEFERVGATLYKRYRVYQKVL